MKRGDSVWEEQRAILCYWKMREVLEQLYEKDHDKYWPYMIVLPMSLLIKLSHYPSARHFPNRAIKIDSLLFTTYLYSSLHERLVENNKGIEEITIFWDCRNHIPSSVYLEYRDEAW